MPDLDIHPVPYQVPGNPYHWEYDNLPLKALAERDEIINNAVETNSTLLREGAGDQGTISNRLDQSLNSDGSLKVAAVNETLHNIAEHEDGFKAVTDEEIDNYVALGYTVSNPVEYVRMLYEERAKLALIADEATDLKIQVEETPSVIVNYTDGTLKLKSSSTVTLQIDGDTVMPVVNFPIEFAHRHYYDSVPVTDDYENFQVNSVSTPYMEGTLRVYINGVRLNSEFEVYVPGNLTTDDWILNKFTPDYEAGTFVLSTPIASDDIILVDFDVALS